MIYYLTSAPGKHTINEYVRSWGPSPGSRIQYLVYDELHRIECLQPGTYVFSDLDRLSPPGLALARQLWKTLSRAGNQVRLLNNPSHVLCRYDLLNRLHREGKNTFRAIQAAESIHSLCYPVFVREETDHNGNITPLIHNPQDLVRHLRALRFKGYQRRDLLIVEFCDTSDRDGIFRKYSAFVVGREILPRHLIFSRDWNLKQPDLQDPHLAAEQDAYLRDNPHQSWLREIFELAGIEYGRIDYSILGDKPQVWEINTNPRVQRLASRLTAAFEVIDLPTNSGQAMSVSIDRELVRANETENRRRRRARQFRKTVGGLTSGPWVRPLRAMMKFLVYSWPQRASSSRHSL